MFRSILSASLAAIVLAVTAGCGQVTPTTAPKAGTGGGTNPPAPAATRAPSGVGASLPDACVVLTAADFKAATGWTVKATTKSNLASVYATDCEWTFTDSGAHIVLGLIAPGGADFLDRIVEYEGGTPVEGLGDRAFRTKISGTLLILTGDILVDLQSILAGDDVDRLLAARILERLRS